MKSRATSSKQGWPPLSPRATESRLNTDNRHELELRHVPSESPYLVGFPQGRINRGPHIQPKTQKALMNRSRSTATLISPLGRPPNKVEKSVAKPGSATNLFKPPITIQRRKAAYKQEMCSEKQSQDQASISTSGVLSPRTQEKTPTTLTDSQSSVNKHQDLPASIRIQPIGTVFLCANCYEYILYPEIGAHPNICVFKRDCEMSTINDKLERVSEMVRLIGQKQENPYTTAIWNKLQSYMKGQCELADVLLLEWLVTNQVDVGLHWEQLFWVIEQLGRLREMLKKKRSVFWMFCE